MPCADITSNIKYGKEIDSKNTMSISGEGERAIGNWSPVAIPTPP
jgi:hypothetical protein